MAKVKQVYFFQEQLGLRIYTKVGISFSKKNLSEKARIDMERIVKLFNILSVMLIFYSCSNNNKVLIEFEEKLSKSQIIKKVIITEHHNEYYQLQRCYQVMLVSDKKLAKIFFAKIKKDKEKLYNYATFTEYSRNDKKEKYQYYHDSGRITKHLFDSVEIYDDSKSDEIFCVDPKWRFWLSNKMLHKYGKNRIKNIDNQRWNIYYGKISFSEKDSMRTFSLYLDKKISFEIWISEDNNKWLEFYRNSEDKLKVVIEGTFLVSNDELEFKEPRNINDVKKTFKKHFERTLLYEIDILGDTGLLSEMN